MACSRGLAGDVESVADVEVVRGCRKPGSMAPESSRAASASRSYFLGPSFLPSHSGSVILSRNMSRPIGRSGGRCGHTAE
jgi:hypothetical protein